MLFPILPSLSLWQRILMVCLLLTLLLMVSVFLGLIVGSTGQNLYEVLKVLLGMGNPASTLADIIWRIRLPRVILAALAGAVLSLGGLVFQTLLRNALAEPYILGISGGSAVGAIIGILMGFSRESGVAFCAFVGSMITLFLLLMMTSGKWMLKKDDMILSGVMVNAFCSAIIMFLISLTQDARLHNILFWLMGDFSMSDTQQVLRLLWILMPCFVILFLLARPLNLLLLGEEMAASMGVDVRWVSIVLLTVTSLMVSATVCYCGLLGFVGLVIPHLLRMRLGSDHRMLIPASMIGGGAYLLLCDLIARTLPSQGEMPVGVVTAMIGAPMFIFLLHRSKR